MPWIERIKKENPKEIYVISNVGLSYGDYLMLTPLFSALKEAYKDTDIIFCTEIDEEINILYGNPNITSIMDFDHFMVVYQGVDRKFAASFDGIYQIPSIIRDSVFKNKNAYIAFCEDVGLTPNSYLPQYFIQPPERKKAQDLLCQHNITKDDKLIILQTEASSPMRNWHPDYTLDLAQRLSEKYKVILLGIYYEYFSEAIQDNQNIIPLIKKLSVRNACALIEQADLVVAPDSLFAHIAGALSQKGLILMSSFPAELRYSLMPTLTVLQKEYFCAPCMLHNLDCCSVGEDQLLKTDRNGNYYSMPCMLSISVDDVYEKVMQMV